MIYKLEPDISLVITFFRNICNIDLIILFVLKVFNDFELLVKSSSKSLPDPFCLPFFYSCSKELSQTPSHFMKAPCSFFPPPFVLCYGPNVCTPQMLLLKL